MEGLYPMDSRGEERAKIIDRCEKKVEGFNNADLFEYCVDHLSDQVFQVVQNAWRGFNPRAEIDGLLQDLMNNPKNLGDFVSHLGLMETIKQMVLEHMIDQRLSNWGY